MRRTLGGLTAFLVLTGTFLVLPVYAAPAPAVEAVPPSIAQVELGSVEQPADGAVVATDNEVVAVGDEADAQVGEQVPTPADDETAVSPAAGDVATTGDEVAGVPALTVSQPETANFSAVGVTWAHDPAVTGVTVDVRVQGIDGTWGVWTTLAQDDVEQTPGQEPDGSDLRDGTAPYFTGPAAGVQVVVQAADGSTPQDVSTQLIDPGTSAADTVLGAPQVTDQAHAGMDMPTIYSRAQWGADESIRTWDPEYSSTIKAATVHHTADSNDYTADEVPSILRSIYAYHTISRGWGDIGYNVLVDKYGRAWEGRYSGARGLSSPVIGAHAGGFNSFTFGISMIGNYDTAPTTPAMISTVAAVIAWKLSLYGVDPNSTTQLTSSGGGTAKYAAGTTVTLPTVFGHRDVGNTSCPGQYGYAQLGVIRAQARALWVTAREPSGSLDDVRGGELTATMSGWALDLDAPTAPIQVHVYVDGTAVGAYAADRRRGDVATAYPGTGDAHGFAISIAATAGRHTVCVFAINVGRGVENPGLGCRAVTVTGPVPEPRGALDVVNVLGDDVLFAGWTFDDDDRSAPVGVHVYIDGRGAWNGSAATRRTDVAAAFPGVGEDHGFVGSVTSTPGAHQVCLYAISIGPGANTALGCRDVVVGMDAHSPVGSLDAVAVAGRTASVRAWAVDPDASAQAVDLGITVDGVRVRTEAASGQRGDVAAAYPGAGAAHGASVTLPLRAGRHIVCVTAVNIGQGHDVQLGCREVDLPATAYDPVGAFDTATVDGVRVDVRGWTIDPDAPTAPAGVHVYVDDRLAAMVTAGATRPDVAWVVEGAGPQHGWSTSVTVPPGAHALCAYAINSGDGTTNPSLGCKTVVINSSAWEPSGSLDGVVRSGSTAVVRGWALDMDIPEGSLGIHVYVDGAPAAVGSTTVARPDVAAAVRGAGPRTGYETSVPLAPGAHRVCAYAINAGNGQANPLLGCRTVAA